MSKSPSITRKLNSKIKDIQKSVDLEMKANQAYFNRRIVNNSNYTQDDLKTWKKQDDNLENLNDQIQQLRTIARDLQKCQHGGKKTKKSKKKMRKTRKKNHKNKKSNRKSRKY
mgnify:CR=1 FL=1